MPLDPKDFAATWEPVLPSGAQWATFEYQGQPVRMKAALCVRKTWHSDADRDAWAWLTAQAIVAEIDNPMPSPPDPLDELLARLEAELAEADREANAAEGEL